VDGAVAADAARAEVVAADAVRAARPVIEVRAPMTEGVARALRAGDAVRISGVLYAARDAAHARLCRLLAEGGEPPFALEGAVIYYVGPTPAPPGRAVGAAGPTTAGRMDAYAPMLIERGALGMVGKGRRSQAVKDAMAARGAVYFAALGGAGALLARHVTAAEVVCYPDLGTEAVRRLTVAGFPAVVAADALGGDLYDEGPAAYLLAMGQGGL
jgi:fumarate hydratase subunit beta